VKKLLRSHALSVGYRHIDCAYVSQNEERRRPRPDIRLRLWHHSEATSSYLKTMVALRTPRVEREPDGDALKKLGSSTTVDLYLMHWPLDEPQWQPPNVSSQTRGRQQDLFK